jgi:hypothetical protein
MDQMSTEGTRKAILFNLPKVYVDIFSILPQILNDGGKILYAAYYSDGLSMHDKGELIRDLKLIQGKLDLLQQNLEFFKTTRNFVSIDSIENYKIAIKEQISVIKDTNSFFQFFLLLENFF